MTKFIDVNNCPSCNILLKSTTSKKYCANKSCKCKLIVFENYIEYFDYNKFCIFSYDDIEELFIVFKKNKLNIVRKYQKVVYEPKVKFKIKISSYEEFMDVCESYEKYTLFI